MSQQHSDPAHAELKKFDREVNFFERIRKDLLKDQKLRGKFVAIRNHNIIDQDRDELKLAKRIMAKFPEQVVLIAKVEKHPPVYEIPSPEVQE